MANVICDAVRLVLIGTRNPLNIGAVARAMGNFGFRHLRVVNPYDPAFREARSAVGASEILRHAEQHNSLADAISDCTLVIGTAAGVGRDPQHPILLPAEASEIIRAHGGSVALLFGSEKRGLSKSDLSYCQVLLKIPTSEHHESMNLGQAVAVCLYEFIRHEACPASIVQPATATATDLDRITAVLTSGLLARGYMPAEGRDAAELKIRRLVRRLALNSRDAETLIGILRHLMREPAP
jgi:TrmH family RNA methyltransferase